VFYPKKQEETLTEQLTPNNLFDIVSSSSTTNSNIPPYKMSYNHPIYQEYHNNYSETYQSPNNTSPLPPYSSPSIQQQNVPITNVVNNVFSTVGFPISSSEKLNIKRFNDDEGDDDEDDEYENDNLVPGAEYLSKPVIWGLTKINRNYQMKKISLNKILQHRDLMKRETEIMISSILNININILIDCI
jgi:hypothetical protein